MASAGDQPQLDLTIPAKYLAEARAVFAREGVPFLRPPKSTDSYTIYAHAVEDGRYDLSLRDEDESIGQLQTWGDVAAYLVLPFQEMVRALRASGYPEGSIPQTPNGPVPNPYDPIEELAQLRPWTDLTDLLQGIPDVLQTRGAGRVTRIGAVRVERVSSRPGEDHLEVWVDSAIALSSLQLLMDRLERGVHIQLWPFGAA